MRFLRDVLLGACAVVVASATWSYAQQAGRTAAMLAPADYLEILQLYAYYSHDVDPGSQRSAAWTFTADGIADLGGRVMTGQALKNFYNGLKTTQSAGVRHFTTNPVVVPTAEGARGSIYLLQVERRIKDGPAEVTLFGKYEDRLVKTRDGWRFKERKGRADTFRGDAAGAVLPYPLPAAR